MKMQQMDAGKKKSSSRKARILGAMLAGALTLTAGIAPAAAAANPFSDVPKEHWAYDAVAELAAEGVVEGYGDATYRGSQSITRYEMAQMTARAMAKSDTLDAREKATVDKLAAEFADELAALGLRVAELEKNADRVKFDGFFRLRSENFRKANSDASKPNTLKPYLEVYTHARVAEGWTAEAKHKLTLDMRNDTESSVSMTNAYAHGKIGAVDVKLGKFDTIDGYAYTHEDPMRGVQLRFGNKLKTQLSAGRISNPNNYFDADYYSAIFNYRTSKATNLMAGWHRLNVKQVGSPTIAVLRKAVTDKDYNLWNIGFDTVFAKNLRFVALYAQSDADTNVKVMDASNVSKKGYFLELDYRYMNVNNPGSYMIMLRNFRVTDATAISSRYDAYTHGNVQGTELGFCYAPVRHVEVGAKYFWGKDVTTHARKDFLRTEVKFFF